jgi:hypothetical protein
MEDNKVIGLSVISDLALDECIEYAQSSNNKKLMTFIKDHEETIKSIMEKELFGKLDYHEKTIVGYLIHLHDRESKNMN